MFYTHCYRTNTGAKKGFVNDWYKSSEKAYKATKTQEQIMP